MAEYKTPENPQQRPRRNRNDSFDWVPLLGLGVGLIVTIAGLFVAYQLTNQFLTMEPLDVDIPLPVVVQLTAPASPTPMSTDSAETPTPVLTPTLVEPISAEAYPAPEEIIPPPSDIFVDGYVEVFNTGGAGLSVRGGPSTDNIKLLVVEEGAVVLVLEGPAEGSGLTWWKILLDDGTEGWVAAQFLTPANPPDGGNE
ncbi:MAG: SH3 domain-containing protein [Candidatus Promineifilaceae bacterium]